MLSSNNLKYILIGIVFTSLVATVCASPINEEHNEESDSVLVCDLCQFLVKEAESFLQSNKTESEIQSELDSVCQHFSFYRTCQTMVDSYLPQVIQLLEQKETPQTVCQQIGICSPQFINFYYLTRNSYPYDSIMCLYLDSMCEKLIESNGGELFIKNQFEQACGLC